MKPLPCQSLRQRAKGLPKEYLSSICLIRINSLLCTRSTTLTYSARRNPQTMSTSKSYFKTICQRKLSTFVSTFASTRKRTRQKNSTLTRSRVGPSTTWTGLETLCLRGNASACGWWQMTQWNPKIKNDWLNKIIVYNVNLSTPYLYIRFFLFPVLTICFECMRFHLCQYS